MSSTPASEAWEDPPMSVPPRATRLLGTTLGIVTLVAACGSSTPLRCERVLETTPYQATLYFVLDRSRSMQEQDRWSSVRNAVADVARAVTRRAEVGLAVFPAIEEEEACTPGREMVAPRLDAADE